MRRWLQESFGRERPKLETGSAIWFLNIRAEARASCDATDAMSGGRRLKVSNMPSGSDVPGLCRKPGRDQPRVHSV